MDIKQNFFTGNTKPAPVSTALIMFQNDKNFRAGYARYLYDNFDVLVDEFQTYGRFLSQQELQDNILDIK